MTTESVKYLLTGEDRATSVFAKVTQAIDANDKSVGDWAKTVKAGGTATQFLSRTLSELPLGPAGQQAAAAASQFEQLYRAKQMGAAGAFAFKAGIVGIVAVLSYQFGKAIGDAIFQTKFWANELERAQEKMKELDQAALASAAKMHSARMEDISLIRDPQEQRQAHLKYLDQVIKNIEGIEGASTKVALQERIISELQSARWNWSAEAKEALTNFGSVDAIKESLEVDRQRLKVLEAQRDSIQAQVSDAKAINDARRQENARLDSLDRTAAAFQQEIIKLQLGDREYERRQALLAAVTDEERKMIEALVEKKHALMDEQQAALDAAKAQEEAVRLQARAIEDAERAKQRQVETDQSYLTGLEAQLIALRDGRDAADEFRAKLSGVSDATIHAGRAIRQQVEAIEAAREAERKAEQERQEMARKLAAFDRGAGSVGAVESRLLTRGAGIDNERQVAENTKKMVTELERTKKLNEQIAGTLRRIETKSIPVFGA